MALLGLSHDHMVFVCLLVCLFVLNLCFHTSLCSLFLLWYLSLYPQSQLFAVFYPLFTPFPQAFPFFSLNSIELDDDGALNSSQISRDYQAVNLKSILPSSKLQQSYGRWSWRMTFRNHRSVSSTQRYTAGNISRDPPLIISTN